MEYPAFYLFFSLIWDLFPDGGNSDVLLNQVTGIDYIKLAEN